jgi:hypothetical protein
MSHSFRQLEHYSLNPSAAYNEFTGLDLEEAIGESILLSPNDIDYLFELIDERIIELDVKTKKATEDIVYSIRESLLKYSFDKFIECPLNPININIDEDGDVFLEWIFGGFRIGFVIEGTRKKSSWFLITTGDKNLFNSTYDGKFNENNLSVIVSALVDFALRNC